MSESVSHTDAPDVTGPNPSGSGPPDLAAPRPAQRSAPPEPRGPAPEAGGEPGGQDGGRIARAHTGFYLYAVGRARARRPRDGEDVLRVRYRDLEALVRPVPFKLPTLDATHVQAHQRVVEGLMRRGTVLPAPYGVIFRARRALVRFLEDQYLTLDEGLAFLEGYWELRVHAAVVEGVASSEQRERADHVYAELRRSARAVIPFGGDEGRVLSAAFLVERGAWIEFVHRAEDLASAHPGLSFDITGPWPPYDFVRMSV